ncbi:MAG: hypothetical protein RL681_800 [Candidatus Parcubacteria bacterium]|jgi:hypothetical protein
MLSGNMTFDAAILKKSFEISYALVRTADTISPDPFAAHFKRLGLEVLSETALGNGKQALAALSAVEYLVRLAGSTGVISSRNGEVIAEETTMLIAHINAALGVPSVSDFDVSTVFSSHDAVFQEGRRVVSQNDEIVLGGEEAPVPVEHFEESPSIETIIEKPRNELHSDISIRAKIRQSAILDKIRQSGNLPDGQTGCRMADIRHVFPDVSERTLRYDIEQLISDGYVERMGNSGPATTYRVREISTA